MSYPLYWILRMKCTEINSKRFRRYNNTRRTFHINTQTRQRIYQVKVIMLLGKTLNITFGACLFFLFHTTSVEKQLLMMPTSFFKWALFRKKKKGGDFLRSSFYRSRFFPFLSKSQFWEIIRTEIPLIVCQPIPEEGPTIGPKVMNMPTHYPYIAEISAIKQLG